MTSLRHRGLRQAAFTTACRGARVAIAVYAVLAAGCAQFQPPTVPGQVPGNGAAKAPSAGDPAAGGTLLLRSGDEAGGNLAASSQPTAAEPSAIDAANALPAERQRLDPDRDHESVDLWQRVRDDFAMPDIDDPLVHKWEQWYAGQPDYVQRMTQRGSRYLFYVLEEVRLRKMPGEIALLPFVESAFNPQATSRAAASGMWQFMPATGKNFDLRQNLFCDDRRDVLVSTRAALDYLQRLHTQFGDWPLALAAYNWGPGNLQRALDRNRKAGLPTDFASLRKLPQETREYLPKLQAVKNIFRDPQAFAISLPPLGNHPYFISVTIERDIDVKLAASLAGLTLDEFLQLNPQLNKPVILAAGSARVLLPYDNANRFLHELAEHQGALASWTAWVAPRTLRPAEAARLTGMPESALRELNQIPPRMLVKVGSTLVVPRAAHVVSDVAAPLADNAMMALAPEAQPLRRVVHKAPRQGETVQAVARRYHVGPADVARWNHLPEQGRFKPGQSVVVMLAPGPRVPARIRSATRRDTPTHLAEGKTAKPARGGRHVQRGRTIADAPLPATRLAEVERPLRSR